MKPTTQSPTTKRSSFLDATRMSLEAYWRQPHASRQEGRARTLPKKLQSELDLAGGGRGAGDGAGGAGKTCGVSGRGRGEDDQVGGVEVGAIEKIEDFGAKLKAEALADDSVFEDGEVPGGQPGADVGVAADVAVETAIGGRSEKGRGIEPLARFAQDHRAREIGIKERAHGIARVAVVGRVVAELRR